MAKFKSKVVEIDAVQWTGGNGSEIVSFMGGVCVFHYGDPEIQTLEGAMRARVGDWIIKGTEGEFYPCKPSVFERKYEPA